MPATIAIAISAIVFISVASLRVFSVSIDLGSVVTTMLSAAFFRVDNFSMTKAGTKLGRQNKAARVTYLLHGDVAEFWYDY
jgi:hypothetical protein